MAELRSLHALLKDSPELASRAEALLTPLAVLDAPGDASLAAQAAAAQARCEAEHTRLVAEGAATRAFASNLFAFGVSLQTADEMVRAAIGKE
eukprot:4340954-Prymnesium_polylepis.1